MCSVIPSNENIRQRKNVMKKILTGIFILIVSSAFTKKEGSSGGNAGDFLDGIIAAGLYARVQHPDSFTDAVVDEIRHDFVVHGLRTLRSIEQMKENGTSFDVPISQENILEALKFMRKLDQEKDREKFSLKFKLEVAGRPVTATN